MKCLLIILSILSTNMVGAQDTFFEMTDGWVSNYCVENESSYQYFGKGGIGGTTYHWYIFNELDGGGNPISQVVFSNDSVASVSSRWSAQMGDEMDADNIYIVGFIQTWDDDFYGTITNYNRSTNDFTLISTFDNRLLSNIVNLNDSTLLIAADMNFPGSGLSNHKAVLFSTNHFGDIMWEEQFGCGYLCNRWPIQILPLSNGNIAFLMDEYNGSLPFSEERERAVLVMLNSEGEMVWEEEVYPGDEENFRIWGGGMVEVDGELLVSYTNPYEYWSTGEAWFNYENTVFLDRFQLDGEYVSTHSYENEIPNDNGPVSIGRYLYRVCQMQKLEDGNILISGTTGYGGLLLKINTEGEVIWNREHFPHEFEANDDAIHWFTIYLCTTPTSDGGYMMAGQYDSSPSELYPGGIQTAIAVKVDQYGCLEEGCQVGIIEPGLENRELRVYPNPSTGVFHVELPENEEVEISVYNMIGEVIFKESKVRVDEYLLDLTGNPRGIYLVRMRDDASGSYFGKIVME